MVRTYLFADEAGCFTFNRERNVSRYYIICTVTFTSCEAGARLLELRRQLAWDRVEMGDFFHASTDRQAVRDRVYETISREKFNIQATIMEKSKAQPQVRTSEHTFYKYGWHYHFTYSSSRYMPQTKELHLTVASIGVKRKRILFEDAVRDVISQRQTHKPLRASFWACQSDPCLWIADYCTWAIQKKYESENKETRSYDLIKDKINYEFDLWSHGTLHYY
jgi:hypothetical protein